MDRTVLRVIEAIAAGTMLIALPRLIGRFISSARIARALRDAPRATTVPMETYAAYDARVGPLSATDALDERTWEDLHLDEIFRQVDHCVSQPGRQWLYHTLRRPSLAADSVDAFDARVRAMARDPDRTARVVAALGTLGDRRAADLEAAFFGALPNRPTLWWIFPLLTLAGVICVAGAFVWPGLLVVWLALCVVNMIAQAVYRPRVRDFVAAMRELPVFVDAARSLGHISIPELASETDTLRDGAVRLSMIRLTTAWLRFDARSANELSGSVYEWANLLFVLDLSAFVLTTSKLHELRDVAQRCFCALGTMDALQSIARWRATLPTWSVPALTRSGKTLEVCDLSHPLVADAVQNGLRAVETSVLITGSNMSGKTTFVRALGVNAVLATAVATVCASQWRAPAYRVRTSIGQTDSLLDGKSYYLAEVESVRRMLIAKSIEVQHMFLLDELFRGTNTGERVAAATATLSWLDRGNDLVVVATHDLEVYRYLSGAFDAYHFRGQVVADVMTFDFHIRPGLSSTHNAIALLEVMQFPPALIADARAVLGMGRSALTPVADAEGAPVSGAAG